MTVAPPNFRADTRPDDEAAVRAIVAGTGFFRDDEIEIAAELVRDRIERGAASGYEFIFADTPGGTVGYACFGLIGCTIGSYDLYWIAVAPDAQGAGLGRRLLGEVERRVSAVGGRHLYAETSGTQRYEPTRRFYTSAGFTAAAELPDFYAPGDSKVIYRKAIQA